MFIAAKTAAIVIKNFFIFLILLMLNLHQPAGWPLSCGGSGKHAFIADCAAKVGKKDEPPTFLPKFFPQDSHFFDL
ncbi:MAG: hypothetical protein IJ243_02495 [Prevotella sp.]|nr:hypothetical protein [Prevotella sp.]